MANKNKKVVRYRKPIGFHVGVLIFLPIMAYLIIVSYLYFTKEHVTIYEVTEKEIADDNRMMGLVLRDETVIYSNQNGHINYYTNEGRKIAKGTMVYTVDDSGRIGEYLAEMEDEGKISLNTGAIRRSIAQYKNGAELSNYSQLRDLKYDLESSALESLAGMGTFADVQARMSENGETVAFEAVSAEQSGILSYTIDGLEEMTEDGLSLALFEDTGLEKQWLRSRTETQVGAPAYKIIPNEDWSIIVPLTLEQIEKLKDKADTGIDIKICKDDLSIHVGFRMIDVEGETFAKLDLNQYMVRYLNDRYLEVELIVNSAEGLKIPTGAIFEKECFTVSKDFLVKGGDSTEIGVTKEVEGEDGGVEFQFVDIHVIMEDEDYLYIDAPSLAQGDWIQNTSEERMQLIDVVKVEGVYNVNEGYCVFHRVEKEYMNPEYCIVKRDTPYGLSVYDHIVVNPEKLKDEDLIY